MKVAIFSDVHGNLPALEAVLSHAGQVDRYVCLGDVVNYGPWSDECVRRIGALPNCECLQGNHDFAFLRGAYDGGHPVAKAFFAFCYPRFHEHEFLAGYREAGIVGRFRAVHTLGDRYIFGNTAVDLDRHYLIGHSHYQFRIASRGFELFNAGSVGQNRGDLRVAQYLIWRSTPDRIEMASCCYDYESVLSEMTRQGYPDICLDYYTRKIGTGPMTPTPPC